METQTSVIPIQSAKIDEPFADAFLIGDKLLVIDMMDLDRRTSVPVLHEPLVLPVIETDILQPEGIAVGFEVLQVTGQADGAW